MKPRFSLLVVLLALPALLLAQGKFGMQVFGDYYYNAARDTAFNRSNLSNSAVNGPKSLQGFLIRRVNFTFDYDINEQFTTRFRLEMDQSGGPSGATTQDGKLASFVKDAWLKWKNVLSGSDLTFGVQPPGAYDVSEAAWGYRSVEKTQMDLRGMVSSRYLGLSLRGKFDDAGMFNYGVMASNNISGANPKDLTSTLRNGDKYNLYSVTLGAKVTKEFQVTLYGDYRPTFDVNDPTSTTAPKATVSNATMTGAAFIGYAVADAFSVGAEGVLQSTSNAYRDPADATKLKAQSKMGISVFGWYSFSPAVRVLARYDMYNPITGSDAVVEKGHGRNYILAGLDFRPAKGVDIIPNVQVETYDSFQSQINGPSTSVSTSINGRMTFAWTF